MLTQTVGQTLGQVSACLPQVAQAQGALRPAQARWLGVEPAAADPVARALQVHQPAPGEPARPQPAAAAAARPSLGTAGIAARCSARALLLCQPPCQSRPLGGRHCSARPQSPERRSIAGDQVAVRSRPQPRWASRPWGLAEGRALPHPRAAARPPPTPQPQRSSRRWPSPLQTQVQPMPGGAESARADAPVRPAPRKSHCAMALRPNGRAGVPIEAGNSHAPAAPGASDSQGFRDLAKTSAQLHRCAPPCVLWPSKSALVHADSAAQLSKGPAGPTSGGSGLLSV